MLPERYDDDDDDDIYIYTLFTIFWAPVGNVSDLICLSHWGDASLLTSYTHRQADPIGEF